MKISFKVMVFIIGTFELNWAEAAQNWYKAKKRHSRIEDASHLLHKGMFIFKVQRELNVSFLV